MSTRRSLEGLLRYSEFSSTPVAGGGLGEIWSAQDILFDRRVAIKTIRESVLLSNSVKAKRAFTAEAKAGARLGQLSRHVVKVLDLGFVDDLLYFVMEWIEPRPGRISPDLQADCGRLSVTNAKAVLFDVCDALALAHHHGIVHSDIAPMNVLFDSEERVHKLSDFGLLKLIEDRLVSRGSGSLLVGGRRDFMPLAVLTRQEEIGYATDVYAAAVTLRVLLEGPACLQDGATPTPPVIRVAQSGGIDAPPQVRQLLTRFVDGHTPLDTIGQLVNMLQRIPG